MNARSFGWLGVLTLWVTPAAADRIALRPGVSIDVGNYRDELRLTTATSETANTRELWFSRVALSVGYEIHQTLLPGLVRGQSSLGLGLVYAEGEFPLHVRQELAWNYPLNSWLELQAGVGVGAQFNFANFSGSFFELSVPLGFRFKRSVELLYSPRITLPLSTETQAVFGGTLAHSVAPSVVPFGVVVRVSFRPFEF